jgi:hypothetical protein
MMCLFVELVNSGGYRQMGKHKKKRRSPKEPMSEEVKAKIKASNLATRAKKVEDARWNKLDIRAQLGETLFGRNGENI